MLPLQTLQAFDEHLAAAGLRLQAVVVGGAALALLGVLARPTRDVDVLAPPLSTELLTAARNFAIAQRQVGVDLADDGLNNGPQQLADVLPADWRTRVEEVFVGQAVLLHTLGRSDLLKTKLFALCDRGSDRADCIALAPSGLELAAALPWLELQDAHPEWPTHVRTTIANLARRLGCEVPDHGL